MKRKMIMLAFLKFFFIVFIIVIAGLIFLFIFKAKEICAEDEKSTKIEWEETEINREINSINDNNFEVYLSVSGPYEVCGCGDYSHCTSCLQKSSVTVGDTIVYRLHYSGDVKHINLSSNCFSLRNISGKARIIQNKNNLTDIYLIISDIDTGYDNETMSIRVTGGTAVSSDGRLANNVETSEIRIFQSDFYRILLWLFPDGNALLTIIISIFGILLGDNLAEKIKADNEK